MSKQNKCVSTVRGGNFVAEMAYDEAAARTSFIFLDNGIPINDPKCFAFGKEFNPLSPFNELVSKKVILFPSKATPFGDEEELLAEIKDFIHKYLDVNAIFEEIASYYVACSWNYEKFNELPYLRALGDYGSGKTRFLQVIGSICYKPKTQM